MKATYQWDSAGKSCLSEMPILRATEVNAVLPKPQTPGPLVSEVPLRGRRARRLRYAMVAKNPRYWLSRGEWLNQFRTTSAISWLPFIPTSNS
jgi:hypothetical protein